MNSQYQTVGEKLPRSDKQHDQKWLWKIVIHVICLLWLGPMITLLYLNFSNHIIGPSIWCPSGKCSIYDDDGQYSIAKISRNDRIDHNIDGALLFVSKGLEVWFTFVAGLLVYEAQNLLRDVPSQYSLTYLEFSDLLSLFKISKWTLPIRDAFRLPSRRGHASKLCAFVLLACFMTLLVNLMGPATGVLILPSVQSIDQHRNASELFKQMESDRPPAKLANCSAESLKNHQYSCAEYVQGSELDSMASFVVAPMRNFENYSQHIHLAESQEYNVQFLAFNFTYNTRDNETDYFTKFNVPSRQSLRMLSNDIYDVCNNTDLMNKSMQVSSQRNGPVIAVSSLNVNEGEIKSHTLGDNKSVTCLCGWTSLQINDNTIYTKCIRNGTGWNSMNSQAGFSIRNLSESAHSDNKLEALVYFSDKTTYYGGDLHRTQHDVACLMGNSSAPCDWDDIFSPKKVDGFQASLSNTNIIEWYFPSRDPAFRTWFEYVSSLQFGVYSVDLSVGNEMSFAHLNSDDSKNGINPDELIIDPLWMLAAWSVDLNGTVDAARFPTLLQGSEYVDDIFSSAQNETWFEFYSLNLFAIAQTMSLISYDFVALNESTPFDKSEGRVLFKWVTRRVWAYGLGTRTSRLGVAVACAGMATVVFRVIFAVYHSRRNDGFKPLADSA